MYRGGAGQLAWWLHRWSGVAVLLFLLIHIIDTGLVFWPELYDRVMKLYAHPFFRLGELGLAAAVLYHALNGIRIAVLDFFPELSGRQRQLFYGVVVLFAVVFIPGAYLMLRPLF